MKFGVIYSIDWSMKESEECPALSGEDAEVMSLFDITESNKVFEGMDEDNPATGHMKFASKELLSRKDFERFLRHTRLTASSTPTMGSIIGYAWGMGWAAPAVAFESDSRDYEEMAYVTPVPSTTPRKFILDPNHPLGLYEHVTATEEYQARCWVRVRDAVVRTYEDGVPNG